MILPILTEPNPILHQETELITEITPEIRQLALDMRETMRNAQGVGLAAPQIGKLLSLCVVEFTNEDHEDEIPFMALINPRITWKSPKKVAMEEGCLSILGVEGKIRRPAEIRVKAKDLDGNTVEIRADGFMARVLQHEIDHLHGVLFTSYIPKSNLYKRPIIDYPRI